jgi:hypothetical protein
MLHGKCPTRKQMQLIKAAHLTYENWLVTKNLPGEMRLEHKYSGKERVLKVRSVS